MPQFSRKTSQRLGIWVNGRCDMLALHVFAFVWNRGTTTKVESTQLISMFSVFCVKCAMCANLQEGWKKGNRHGNMALQSGLENICCTVGLTHHWSSGPSCLNTCPEKQIPCHRRKGVNVHFKYSGEVGAGSIPLVLGSVREVCSAAIKGSHQQPSRTTMWERERGAHGFSDLS